MESRWMKYVDTYLLVFSTLVVKRKIRYKHNPRCLLPTVIFCYKRGNSRGPDTRTYKLQKLQSSWNVSNNLDQKCLVVCSNLVICIYISVQTRKWRQQRDLNLTVCILEQRRSGKKLCKETPKDEHAEHLSSSRVIEEKVSTKCKSISRCLVLAYYVCLKIISSSKDRRWI